MELNHNHVFQRGTCALCFFENIGVEIDPLRKQLSQNLRQLVLGIMQILHITLI